VPRPVSTRFIHEVLGERPPIALAGGQAVMNRKLIRPDLSEIKDHFQQAAPKGFRVKKAIPPEQTNAENFYYQKQMANRTRMVILLKDGEEIRGVIEWYDRHAIKVHRPTEPNILLLKDNIKYMYKENEDKEQDGD
jgi:sRNA-binding regulator protein Hfq